MHKICFIEKWSDRIPEGSDECEFISLDPSVSFLMELKGIDHSILEDYYSEDDLRSGNRDYFDDQLEWFKALDGHLKKEIGICGENGIDLATSCYLRIKYFVDMLIINSRILNWFFEENPGLKEIVYFQGYSCPVSEISIFDFMAKNRAVFGLVLDIICASKGVKFKYIGPEDGGGCISSGDPRGSLWGPLKRVGKSIHRAFKYDKLKAFRAGNPRIPENIMFMHSGSIGIDTLLGECVKKGLGVYVNEKDVMYFESSITRCPVIHAEKSVDTSGFLKECKNAVRSEFFGKALEWINIKCGVDVSGISSPVLESFFINDCPGILGEYCRYKEIYQENGIKFVIARMNTTKDSLGPVLAAKFNDKTVSIGVQHSCFALDVQMFGVFETATYDYLLTTDAIGQDFYQMSLSSRYDPGCEPVQSSHYLKHCENIRTARTSKRTKEKVVYLEKRFPDIVRSFNNMIYPLNWYYRFQKTVIDALCDIKGYDFIYKHAQGQAWADNSILKYIGNKTECNITVSSGSFTDLLRSADRVIMDYPSTALFEASAAGVPALCIVPGYMDLLEKGKRFFGKSIRVFKDEEDAVDAIREFLFSDASQYVNKISLEDRGFIDILEGINDKTS